MDEALYSSATFLDLYPENPHLLLQNKPIAAVIFPVQ